MFAKLTEKTIALHRSRIKTIFFDFDGTIADTLTEFVKIVNRLAIEFGYRVASPEDIQQLRQLSSKEILRVAAVPIWQIPFLIRRLKKELNREIEGVTPIPGMKATLQHLKSRGVKLGILTSNSQENVSKFLRERGMEDLFDRIYAGTSLFGKDKILRKILRQENLAPDEFMYVGDETRDVDAARKSGVRAIAVGWGFNTPDALAHRQPDFLLHEPRELIEILEGLECNDLPLATLPQRGAAPRSTRQNTDKLTPLAPRRRHRSPLLPEAHLEE